MRHLRQPGQSLRGRLAAERGGEPGVIGDQRVPLAGQRREGHREQHVVEAEPGRVVEPGGDPLGSAREGGVERIDAGRARSGRPHGRVRPCRGQLAPAFRRRHPSPRSVFAGGRARQGEAGLLAGAKNSPESRATRLPAAGYSSRTPPVTAW